MFPPLLIKVSGLDPKQKYVVMLEIISSDNQRYKFFNGAWMNTGTGEQKASKRMYIHPDSPAVGIHWMNKAISFHKIKLTNNQTDNHGYVFCN